MCRLQTLSVSSVAATSEVQGDVTYKDIMGFSGVMAHKFTCKSVISIMYIPEVENPHGEDTIKST